MKIFINRILNKKKYAQQRQFEIHIQANAMKIILKVSARKIVCMACIKYFNIQDIQDNNNSKIVKPQTLTIHSRGTDTNFIQPR